MIGAKKEAQGEVARVESSQSSRRARPAVIGFVGHSTSRRGSLPFLVSLRSPAFAVCILNRQLAPNHQSPGAPASSFTRSTGQGCGA